MVSVYRPGRLDKVLYVALPSPSGRAAILTALARRTPLSAAVDLAAVAHDARAGGFSGADLQQLLREASVAALKASKLLVSPFHRVHQPNAVCHLTRPHQERLPQLWCKTGAEGYSLEHLQMGAASCGRAAEAAAVDHRTAQAPEAWPAVHMSVACAQESFRDKTSGDLVVCLQHFEAALACMGPSVSAKACPLSCHHDMLASSSRSS